MNVRMMFGDVWRSLWQRPVTQTFPYTPSVPPKRLRGALHWDPTDCTGCALCVKDCPADALELTTIDRKEKRFVLGYHVDRCTFCEQCVVSCRFNCLSLTDSEWVLAGTDRKQFEVWYGNEDDLHQRLAGSAGSAAEDAAT